MKTGHSMLKIFTFLTKKKQSQGHERSIYPMEDSKIIKKTSAGSDLISRIIGVQTEVLFIQGLLARLTVYVSRLFQKCMCN